MGEIVHSKGTIKIKMPKKMKLLKLRNKVKQIKKQGSSSKNVVEENVTRLIQHEAVNQFMGLAKTKKEKMSNGQGQEKIKKNKVYESAKNVTLHSEDVKTLKQVFHDLDKNNIGTLERGEFRRAATRRPDLGSFVRPKDLRHSFGKIDTN